MNPTRLFLHFVHTPHAPVEIAAGQPVKIGRAATAGLDLGRYFTRSLTTVSREHCEIAYQAGNFTLTDLNSFNGTWVNGTRLRTGSAKILRDGDEIRVANAPFLTARVRLVQTNDGDATTPLPDDPLLLSLLDELRKNHDALLVGVAGMGKSTLLRRLLLQEESGSLIERYLPERPLFCLVDGLALHERTLAGFCRLLIAALQAASQLQLDPASYPPSPEEELAEALRGRLVRVLTMVTQTTGRRVIFLLDHLEAIYPDLPGTLFWLLQKLKESQSHISYILTLRDELDSTDPYVSQFLRVIHPPRYQWLPLLDEEQLLTLLSSYRLTPEQVDAAIELGGGQPRLTELVAQSLHTLHSPLAFGQLPYDLLTERLLLDHCRTLWLSLTPSEREALCSLATETPRMSFATQRHLTERKKLLFETDTEEVRFRSALFRAFAQQHGCSDQQPEPPGGTDDPTKLMVGGRSVPPTLLTKREQTLLSLFLARAGQVCTFDEIAQQVWAYDAEQTASQEMITSLVHNLRQKLDRFIPQGGKYIENVRGRGYSYHEGNR